MSERKIWTEEEVLKIQSLIHKMDIQSLDQMVMIETEQKGPLINFLIDDSPGPQEILEENDRRLTILKYVNKLKPKESLVIKLRYGLDDGVYRTLEEIGEYFGVTRERIRQIEENAIVHLKRLLIKTGKYKNINDL